MADLKHKSTRSLTYRLIHNLTDKLTESKNEESENTLNSVRHNIGDLVLVLGYNIIGKVTKIHNCTNKNHSKEDIKLPYMGCKGCKFRKKYEINPIEKREFSYFASFKFCGQKTYSMED